jgi:hydrogenase maturation factor
LSRVLRLGKVSKTIFNRCVLPFIPVDNELELDGATLFLKGSIVIAHSPSIGVPINSLGFFAFHYSASNVACKFGVPRHLISGIYLPINTTEDDLSVIAESLGNEAKKYNVTITAGQTATYFGLDLPLLTATCLGESSVSPDPITVGDKVLLVGDVGGEVVWLEKLARKEDSDIWRSFTPLPIILDIQKVKGVKLMHDVSEGGVKGALYEVATSNKFGLITSSEDITYYPGVEEITGDILRAPTYGTLIVIADPNSVDIIRTICSSSSITCTEIGKVTNKRGLNFDGQFIGEQSRIKLDEIYGNFRKKNKI